MAQPPHLTLVEKKKLNGNRLLTALSDEDQAILQPALALVTLMRGDVMITPHESITHVYFPIDCLGSIVATIPDNRRIEVGLFGRDGMLSASLLHGSTVTPHETFTQVEGTALRIGADELDAALRTGTNHHLDLSPVRSRGALKSGTSRILQSGAYGT
jgi:hypothetical protein